MNPDNSYTMGMEQTYDIKPGEIKIYLHFVHGTISFVLIPYNF